MPPAQLENVTGAQLPETVGILLSDLPILDVIIGLHPSSIAKLKSCWT